MAHDNREKGTLLDLQQTDKGLYFLAQKPPQITWRIFQLGIPRTSKHFQFIRRNQICRESSGLWRIHRLATTADGITFGLFRCSCATWEKTHGQKHIQDAVREWNFLRPWGNLWVRGLAKKAPWNYSRIPKEEADLAVWVVGYCFARLLSVQKAIPDQFSLC